MCALLYAIFLEFHNSFYYIKVRTIVFQFSCVAPCDLAATYCKPAVSVSAECCACVKHTISYIPPCSSVFCECCCLKVYYTLLYIVPCTAVFAECCCLKVYYTLLYIVPCTAIFAESCVIPCYFTT